MERDCMTISEAAVRLGISRIGGYAAAKRGELPVLRFGRRMLVPKPAFEEMLLLRGNTQRGVAA